MIDPVNFDRVRIVQDKGIDADGMLPEGEEGTKVLTDVFDANDDSLFPLQGALGYEIHQTLFIGPRSLVVEGAADLLYIQSMSAVLERNGRTALSSKWTITPVGGAGKVPTYVALLGAQKGLTIATLLDIQEQDEPRIAYLYKQKLLRKKNVLTFAQFTGTTEADIEDMFGEAFYLTLVNAEYKSELQAPISVADLASGHPRVVRRIEEVIAKHPLKRGQFSHFRPARYFAERIGELETQIPAEAKDRFEAAFRALNGLL
jgi:hypothetical protein